MTTSPNASHQRVSSVNGHAKPHDFNLSDAVVMSTFVFADLAGYTALTEAHGDERAADVAAAFCEELRALLGCYGAEEIKAVGDALIVRVLDAGQALALAARIVGDFDARDRALGVRVGMHTGTAVHRGDDWFGSAVNVASRIADLAHAGEVIVSAATRDAAVSCALAGELRSRGQRSLKHVPEPTEVFALVREGVDGRHELPVDPVCWITVDPAVDEAIVWRGVEYHFCLSVCAEAFRETPTRYVRRPASRALVLVSDEAGEGAAQRLARAYAKGRIDGGKFERRMEGAWSARTRADLKAVTHDLPRRRRHVVQVWQLPIFPLILTGARQSHSHQKTQTSTCEQIDPGRASASRLSGDFAAERPRSGSYRRLYPRISMRCPEGFDPRRSRFCHPIFGVPDDGSELVIHAIGHEDQAQAVATGRLSVAEQSARSDPDLRHRVTRPLFRLLRHVRRRKRKL